MFGKAVVGFGYQIKTCLKKVTFHKRVNTVDGTVLLKTSFEVRTLCKV